MIPFGTRKAPSPAVVVPYYLTAAVVFLLLTILLLFSATDLTGHYFQPRLLTITHLATLGWGTMIILGASHQLLPVVMEVHLYSERLARWCYYLLLPGIALLAFGFWVFNPGWPMQAGALLVLSAFVLYAVNVNGTARQKQKGSISSDCIVTASWWLVLTALLGAVLVFNLRYAFLPESHLYYLKIHAHLGMTGWFLLLIMGVASRLIPMFLLSHEEPGKEVTVAYYCINAALILFLIMAFLFHTEKYWLIPAVLVLVGVLLYGAFIRRAYRKAVRKKTDMPMKMSLFAIVLMILPFVLLGILFFISSGSPQATALSLAYGISIFGGFITVLIFGQTFKTLPFIIWMHRYKKLLGKTKTPLPKDLYKAHWVTWQFYIYMAGLLATLAGVLLHSAVVIRAGCAGLVLTAIFYNINVFHILLHKMKKDSKNETIRPTGYQGSVRISEG